MELCFFRLNLLGRVRGTRAHLNAEKEGNVKLCERGEQLMELNSKERGRKWEPGLCEGLPLTLWKKTKMVADAKRFQGGVSGNKVRQRMWGQRLGEEQDPHTCTAALSAPTPAAGQHQPTPPLETPGHSQASLGWSLVALVKAMVFPVVMYGYNSRKKAEHWRIDAFELWCWRRLLRVPWTART